MLLSFQKKNTYTIQSVKLAAQIIHTQQTSIHFFHHWIGFDDGVALEIELTIVSPKWW